MVEGDRRNGRDHGRHDVRGVEPAAEPDLHDRHVHARPPKQLERHRRRHLEEGRLDGQGAVASQGVHGVADIGHGGDERVLRDRTSVDDESFREVDEMRRGVARRAVAGRAQRRIDHRRHRALAVGAGDVHRAEGALGVAESRDERGDVLEAELDPELLEAEEVGEWIQLRVRRRFGGRRGAGGRRWRALRA